MKKKINSFLALMMALMILLTSVPVMAEELPYDTYNYDYWIDIFKTPAAYVPEGSVLGTDLTFNGESIGAFSDPQDLCVAPDGSIYVADTGNQRIVVLNSRMTEVTNVITGFDNAGMADGFNKPTGLAISDDGDLYVADSMNHRIVQLDPNGALVNIIEIPSAAATQALGANSYTVGTHVEGMSEIARTMTTDAGETYAIVSLPAGSPLEATDAQGLTYTVVAESDIVQPFTVTAEKDGAKLELSEKADAITYTGKDGAALGISTFDPIPNKDIFIHIGRLVRKAQGNPVSMTKISTLSVQGVAIDDEGALYLGGEKGITKLTNEGELVRTFSSYKDAAGAQVSLTTISEFGVDGDTVYIRDDANRIIVLDAEGHLEKIIASNAIRVTDGEGNEVAMIRPSEDDSADNPIVGIEVLGDKLMIGRTDGTVAVTTLTGERIAAVENDSVLRMDAQGSIVETITGAVSGKTTERFAGLTGVAMADGKLCVAGADNRVLVIENGNVVHTAQNNCVHVTDVKGNLLAEITGYEQDGAFVKFAEVGGVQGVALGYTADTTKPETQRVQRQISIATSEDELIVLDASNNVTRIVKDPDSEVLEDGYVFTPLKVSVDYAGRVYCVAQNMFEGIMVFETNGDFTGFFGTIEVTITAWEKFWRKLATKEERSKQQLFIPTEFTGIDIDEEGFVYASNVDNEGVQAVRRLNPKGEDVIRLGANANLGGDLMISGTSQYGGPSKIVDVVYREKGMYSLLDSKRGRIFTYDHEGNLLYIFGGIGTQAGTLTTPVAVEFAGDRILALDSAQASILVYAETEYGRLINEAVGLRFDGDESQAVGLWEQVLRMDENNELANVGIGKAYLSAGDNEKAMEYLKRGMSQDYYSVAFKRYRNEVLKENVQGMLTGLTVLVIALVVFFKIVKPRMKKKGRKV